MSRTYRRKNEEWDFHRSLRVGIRYFSIGYIEKERLEKNSKEYKKARKVYHSDTSYYRSSVPAWFVNMFCERPMRQKSRMAIHHWTKDQETDLILPQYVHDAGWKYY